MVEAPKLSEAGEATFGTEGVEGSRMVCEKEEEGLAKVFVDVDFLSWKSR